MMQKKSNQSLSKTFLIFIVVSLLFWLLTKLSKTYQETIDVSARYQNLPIDKVLVNELPGTIKINVKASGFKLLYANLMIPEVNIDASVYEEADGNTYWLNVGLQKNKIQSQLSELMVIQYFEVPRIKVSLAKLSSKYVPITPQIQLNFKDNFDAYSVPVITPDSILVSGPATVIDTLQFIKTTFYEFDDIEGDIDEKFSIDEGCKEKGIAFNESEVGFQLKVMRFTEANLEIPYSVINIPEKTNISTFPNKVKISFKVALADYEKVNPSLFEINCDYKESFDNGLNFLIPKVMVKPDFIKDLHLRTQKIEYFITK